MLFKHESEGRQNLDLTKKPWIVVIVDDDVDVHKITRLTLRDFLVEGRPLELISAYSGAEGKAIMSETKDVALAIVDVVMETDHAGLDLVHAIRYELGNHVSRLVLRTGQAGQAPEHEVVTRYDINDYKEKTELTSQKLKTMCYSLIRSYRDINTIEMNRLGMRRVLESASHVLASSTLGNFASAVLEQVMALLSNSARGIYASTIPSLAAQERRPHVIAATVDHAHQLNFEEIHHLPEKIQKRFDQAIKQKKSLHFEDGYVAYLVTQTGHINLLSVDCNDALFPFEIELLELYCSNVALTYEMLLKGEDMVEAQRQLVLLMGEAVESRSKETGAHVKRVSLISEKLAKNLGLPEDEVAMIKYAAPLHDIGKISIPDHILHKPGKLDEAEWTVMQSHASMGGSILSGSRQRLFMVGADIANYHHEKWDGSGYPLGLVEEKIPLSARIVSVADVFDALGSKRCYKEAWDSDRIKTLILAESGKMFDPKIVTELVGNFEEYLRFRQQYPDED